MIAYVLGAIAAVFFVLVLIGLAKSVQKHDKQNGEFNNRLQMLEDRFYHPANYNDAFFRPLAKKKEDAKEG